MPGTSPSAPNAAVFSRCSRLFSFFFFFIISFGRHRWLSRSRSVSDVPGQPKMLVGDLLVAINGRSLALEAEDDADELLAKELRHGVALRLQREAKASLAGLLSSLYGPPERPSELPEWPAEAEDAEEEEEVMVFQAALQPAVVSGEPAGRPGQEVRGLRSDIR